MAGELKNFTLDVMDSVILFHSLRLKMVLVLVVSLMLSGTHIIPGVMSTLRL